LILTIKTQYLNIQAGVRNQLLSAPPMIFFTGFHMSVQKRSPNNLLRNERLKVVVIIITFSRSLRKRMFGLPFLTLKAVKKISGGAEMRIKQKIKI
jgi:hypothetical protein